MKRTLLVLLSMILFVCAAFTGCTTTKSERDPKDVISEAYGNSQFTISFNAGDLSQPIDDLTYSANSMPTLPTPEKVGYIFSGWYLDSAYTVPCIDGILYLYMKDVTLYAKWEKESFVQNGTYDVEYSARILEDTVRKGELTDSYGGYKDFTESLISDEIYLEKTGDKLLLKLQFDSEKTLPMTASLPIYSVRVASASASAAYIEESINSYADAVKTLFINVSDYNLEETLYLDVSTANWDNDSLTDAERDKTVTRYTVAFDITRIIGFSKSYVDTSVPLEEGWYLAKSYYKQQTNEDTMASSFNPVYSYIYSDGKNYTLVKQNIPYSGIASSTSISLSEMIKKYYERAMSLIPVGLYYEIQSPPEGNDYVNSDYYPGLYEGLYYGDYAVEYHADTGKFYNIYDLGDSVDKTLMIMGGVTGFMEVAMGMSYSNQILSIDYEHLIKLSSVDYEPLTGDCYQFQSDMQYYPGYVNDLNEKGLAYDIAHEYGMSSELYNFFFSAENLAADTSKRTQYSSRITVKPTASTNAQTVADSRYRMAHFDVNAQIFGYKYDSGETLYADCLTYQTMGTVAMRRNVEIANGKSCEAGETVRLSEIYSKYCDAEGDFAAVGYNVYPIKDGKPDYSSEIKLSNSAFVFEKDVVVVFTTENETGKKQTLVELIAETEPVIRITDTNTYPFDPDGEHKVNDTMSFPYVVYSWQGKQDKFIDEYYPDDSLIGEKQYSINTVKVAVFSEKSGTYRISYGRHNSTDFIISSEDMIVVFELTNRFGERYYYEIPLTFNSAETYEITDEKENIIAEGNVRYDESGERYAIAHTRETRILTENNYKELLTESYTVRTGDAYGTFTVGEFSVYTQNGKENITANPDASGFAQSVWETIKDSEYALIRMKYVRGKDSLLLTFAYNVTFGGSMTAELFGYEDYFAGYEYIFKLPELYSATGTKIISGTANILSRNANLSRDNLQYKLSFTEAGEYQLTQRFYTNGMELYFTQQFNVLDQYADVYVTYVTDAEHPFNDGTCERTVKYNLSENIYTLKKSDFGDGISDILYGWATSENGSSKYRSNTLISSFVSDFNAQEVTLYTVWDPGLTITVNAGEGNTFERTYLMNSYGQYEIKVTEFNAVAPDGYKCVGFTGGIFGDEIVSDTKNISDVDRSNSELFVINAVFKKEFTVKFSVDAAYSDAFFRNEIVLDGNTVTGQANKMRVTCKVSGYRFAGWYVQGDESKTVIDLATYPVTADVTLVAKFVPTESEAL